jgi:hypothetical protein
MCEDLVADVERALKGDAVISCGRCKLKRECRKGTWRQTPCSVLSKRGFRVTSFFFKISNKVRLPAELKHINKRRKRN